jgi:Protein of unknown function (DUF935)
VAGRLQQAVSALLGISTYQQAPRSAVVDEAVVEDTRRAMGGQIQLPVWSRTRWYLDDLETAEYLANTGDLSLAAQLMSIARRDGIVAGVLSTRTSGLVGLPRKFKGDPEIIRALEPGKLDVRSVYDELMPPSELALLAADGLLLGVGVAELLPVKGRNYPVMCRLDPQFLRYVWYENQWYYHSSAGRLPVTPGDGHWVLHTPGGRLQPWLAALWRCVGRAYIRKDHASLYKDNWEAKLANPARVAVAPQGSTEAQKDSWFRAIMAWGVNSVFGMTPGYDVKLLESNGRGYESFQATIADQNQEIIIAIAGQTVTTDGGAGFQNSDIHKAIRADLIKDTADTLVYTINTQVLPGFIVGRYGEDALEQRAVVVEYDVTPPKDRNSEAQSLTAVGTAVSRLVQALAPAQLTLDIRTLCERFAIPLVELSAPVGDGDTAERSPAGLRLIQGGKAEVSGDGAAESATDAAVASGQPASDAALTGPQVASILDIVRAVAAGEIPRDAAIGIMKRAFFVDDAQANELLGSVGNGFIPTTTDEAAA